MEKQVCTIKTTEAPHIGECVVGVVVSHPQFLKGTPIITGTVVYVSDCGKMFETLNSNYTIVKE